MEHAYVGASDRPRDGATSANRHNQVRARRPRRRSPVIPEIVGSQTATRYLRELGPAVVILGPAATARDLNAARVRFMLPHATVLALSADLFGYAWPEPEGELSVSLRARDSGRFIHC